MIQDPISHLFDVIEGPIRFGLLKWAVDEGVFDLCEQPSAATSVASTLKADPIKVTRALQTLTALGYMICRDDCFQIDSHFAPYLLRSSNRCFAQTFLNLSQTRHVGLSEMTQLIAGQRINEIPPAFDAAHWRRMQHSLAAFHRSGAGATMLQALMTVPEWTTASRIMDVGGGSLDLAHRIIAQKPDAHVTLFDLPALVDSLQAPTDARISVSSGSYKDAKTLPDGPFEIIWSSMSLYFAGADLEIVLSDLGDRLSESGALVSFHEDLNQNRCAPARHVIGRTMPALTGKDMSFSAGAIAAALDKAGLTHITSETIETSFGPYRLDVARRKHP